MPFGGCPSLFDCYQTMSGNYCFPRSSDCTDLNNFVELQLGQACDGDPACANGLTCIGICSQGCTGAPGQGNCPNGYACETFNFQSGPESFCAPPVREGQSCAGTVACPVGHCLLNSVNQAICYKDCTGDPSQCNNAQMCNVYRVGNENVGLCEPPGVPPRPDAGIPPDTGVVNNDSGMMMIDPDGGMMIDPDGGVPVDPDGGVQPGQDAGTIPTECTCDTTYSCDPGCQSCDPECGACTCDETYDCDPGCEECDPECSESGGCSGCTSTERKGDNTRDVLVVLGLFAGALALLGIRRFMR
jgi:hypothetical protein